jgi:hypothetical protein
VKKTAFITLSFLVVFSLSNSDLSAQYYGTDFQLSLGTVTDDNFTFDPFFWTAGLSFDIHFGDLIMVSPEGYIQVNNFNWDRFYVVPSVLVNLKLSSLFVGAGVTKAWIIGSEVPGSPSTNLDLKLNAGVRGAFSKLTAFIITPFDNFLKSPMIVGASFGFGL